MLKNPSRLFFKRWSGLNTWQKPKSLPPTWWIDSMNVLVNGQGSAEVLRSPFNFNDSLGTGNPVTAMVDFPNSFRHCLVFDALDGGTMKSYIIEDDFSNTVIRTPQTNFPFVSLVVNDKLYRLKQDEFIQIVDVSSPPTVATVYEVGIDEPTDTPVIAYSGATGYTFADGVSVSYAYYNTTTGHVSRPSPISNRLTASSGAQDIDVDVVESSQDGVDAIVFFASLDGGAELFLLVDSDGDPITAPNATDTITLDMDASFWDTLTPEPVYNFTPPLGARSMFRWKDRLFLLNFPPGAPVPMSGAVYNGFESVYIGIPWESWPGLNQFNIPNKGEQLIGGIGTTIGALLLSDADAYLLSGYPTDKTSGNEAVTSVSEHLQPLNWRIGTRSHRSIQNTPFGEIWLDQERKLQLWDHSGAPSEFGIPIRKELADLDPDELASAEGKWFQGGINGGWYVLTGKTLAGPQKMFIVSIYQDPETLERRMGYGISDVQAYSLETVSVFNEMVFFLGATNHVQQLFDAELEGDGWGSSDLFFEIMLGNDDNFAFWHSMSIDGDIDNLTVTVRDPDELAAAGRTVTLAQDGSSGESWFGVINEYGRRKILRFEFDESVDLYRQITNLQVYYANKSRNL